MRLDPIPHGAAVLAQIVPVDQPAGSQPVGRRGHRLRRPAATAGVGHRVPAHLHLGEQVRLQPVQPVRHVGGNVPVTAVLTEDGAGVPQSAPALVRPVHGQQSGRHRAAGRGVDRVDAAPQDRSPPHRRSSGLPSTSCKAVTAPDSLAERMSASVHTARPESYKRGDQAGLEPAEGRCGDRTLGFAEDAGPAPHVALQEVQPAVLVGLVRRFAPEADGGDRLDGVPQPTGGGAGPVADAWRRRIGRPGLEEGVTRLCVIHGGDCAPERRRRTLETTGDG